MSSLQKAGSSACCSGRSTMWEFTLQKQEASWVASMFRTPMPMTKRLNEGETGSTRSDDEELPNFYNLIGPFRNPAQTYCPTPFVFSKAENYPRSLPHPRLKIPERPHQDIPHPQWPHLLRLFTATTYQVGGGDDQGDGHKRHCNSTS
jgi:hypothetical protein